jgi:sigma-B regulation protein RsbU (phosphoserine phosphatase)
MEPSLVGLGPLLGGSLLAFLGVVALVVSLYRRHGIDAALASFGAFSLLYGVRLIFMSELMPALGVSQMTVYWVINTITYLIQIPAWLFFYQILGPGPHSLVLWWLRIISAFAVLGVLSDLVQARPGTLSQQPNNVMVIVGMGVAIYALGRQPRPRPTNVRILIVGFIVFGFFVLNDNLVSLGFLPWQWRNEAIGFAFFVACLGVIAARRFLATEHQLATVEGELDAARQIQMSILPTQPPTATGLDIAVRFLPTSAVAGDFYDFIESEPGQLGIVVADVSGHGVPAALIASMVKVAIKSRHDYATQPARLLTEVNQTLRGSFERAFVTATFAALDTETGALQVANAGHPPPLHWRTAKREVVEIGGRGPLLGRFPNATYEDERLSIRTGDRLVLFTDGLIEARNTAEEPFGDQRLAAVLIQHSDLPPEELCDAILEEVRQWTGRPAPLRLDDDLTLVVVAR